VSTADKRFVKGAVIVATIVTIAALATGCAGTTNSVDNAGVTQVDVAKTKDEVTLHAVSGKEYDTFIATVDLEAGTGTVTASKAKAFEGQKAAADVEKAFADYYAKATPEARDLLLGLADAVRRIILGQ